MRIWRYIKLLFVSLLLLSCKKQYKQDTTVNFHLYNPVTNEAFSNVTVKIIEQKDVSSTLQLSSEYETKVIWEGKTDAYGKVSHSFKAYKNDKYTYWHYVDESFMVGKVKIEQPEYGPLIKNTDNHLIHRLTMNIICVDWIKNINCNDSNDQFRWRQKSILRQEESWSVWSPISTTGFPSYYQGCFDLITSTHTHTQDIVEVEMEVTKNGVTTIIRDTFYLTGQNGTDTLKLFY